MAEIVLERVSKRFGETVAIHPTDLAVERGEFFILVGPSGSGKSTLLNMIVGLETVSGGRILVDGRDVTGVDPSRRRMAMVFQSYALYPHMSIFDNLAFPLRMAGIDAAGIERRVRRAAETLGIAELLDRRPAALSGGQRQRVAMGRAMVREPEIFLLDEPLSNLDARLRVQMRAEIARLHREIGATTLYVTHDQTEAMTLGDRIAVLDTGGVQQTGTPRELYETPANLFVAGFIGAPAMNFVPALLRNGRLRLPWGALPPPPDLPPSAAERPLVAGVRPEHLRLPEGGGAESFPARVERTEWLGAELLARLSVACEEPGLPALPPELDEERDGRLALTARLDPSRKLGEGDTVHLSVAPGSLHLFDAEEGTRLGRTVEGGAS